VQRQQLESIVSRSTAYGDGGDEVIQPNSGVLLPIELDYAVAKLDPFRQWCGTNQEAKALRSAQPVAIAAECFQLAFFLEATRVASRTR
jgi:hypothetical protein